MQLSEFYGYAYNYLINQTDDRITLLQLEDYLCIKSKNYSLNDAYIQLLDALQDYHSMRNIIQFNNRKEQFSEILFDFDFRKISTEYNKETLFEKFKNTFVVNNADSSKNSWKRYAKAVVSSACFMNTFENIKVFKSFIRTFQYNDYSQEALPLLLEKEIFGMGFATACLWLKELGYTEYAKPDRHMLDLFSALGLCDKTSDNVDISCFKAIRRLAEECNVTPYELDKVLWLICSGDYYKQGKKINDKSLKEKFINDFKDKFKNDIIK